MATTIIDRLRMATVTVFVMMSWNVFGQTGSGLDIPADEQEFYLTGDYIAWVHMGDEPKFSLGDDGLWHKTVSLRTDQGVKVVNVEQILYSANLSTPHNSVTDEMIKNRTPIVLETNGNANDDDDLTSHPIIYLQTEATREFILESETMTLTVAGVPHDITLTPVTQGTAQLSTRSARWGEKVTITLQPMGGYSLKNIEVKAEDGSLITVIDEVFEMPDQPVSVTVTYEESRSGQCGDNLAWYVNESYSTLSISGNGPMYDYQEYTQPWLNFKDRITDLYIDEGVETLGAYAFIGMENLMSSVSIPNGVVSIGESCFEYTKISGVQLPPSLQSIGKNAFHNAEITVVNLEECTSPEFTTLPEGVFRSTSLNTVTIPANITSFGENSFADNYILEKVTLLCTSISELGGNAFGDVDATLEVDDVDLYHAIRKVGSQWGNARNFTIRPLDEKSFRYAVIEGIESGYTYTGQPIELAPRLFLCDEELSADDYELKYYNGDDEVSVVQETGTYRCVFTPSAGTDYKDDIAKTFVVSSNGFAYIDENGEPQTLAEGTYTMLTEDIASLSDGWYVVDSDVSVSGRIEVTEDGAKILLCDGSTLTAERGIHCSNKEFAIYGQSNNTGKLFANGYDNGAGIGGNIHESGPILTINGGDIVVTSHNSSAAIGGGDQGYWSGTFGSNVSVTVNGGIVEAVADGYGAGIGGGGSAEASYNCIAGSGGIIILNGGQVNASSVNGYGMGPGRIKDFAGNDGEKGTIHFGWNDPSDLFTMTSVCGNLVFDDNFALKDEYLKATQDNVNEKGGIRLVPAHVIDIDENMEHGSVEMDQNACPVGVSKPFSVYVYPDPGYEVDEIKVCVNEEESAPDHIAHFAPSNNNEIPLTKISEHEYSFEMPNADVNIKATFKEDTVTGIEGINAAKSKTGRRFNVMGQPVGRGYKGIVIEDGQKFIVK